MDLMLKKNKTKQTKTFIDESKKKNYKSLLVELTLDIQSWMQ